MRGRGLLGDKYVWGIERMDENGIARIEEHKNECNNEKNEEEENEENDGTGQ
jgi:hypothetical protein